MKKSKQILLGMLILFLLFASGCAKGLLKRDVAELDSRIVGIDDSLEHVEEELGEEEILPELYPELYEKPVPPRVEEEILPRLYEKPRPRDFGTAEKGMPGDGYTGSFIAEPFRDRVDEEKFPEPFLPENGEDKVATLVPEQEVRRRLLPYRSSYILRDINFKFDRYDLDDKSRAILENNVAYLKTHPIIKIEIQGHCDERGTNSYNISLGQRRAQSTKSYLVSLGIDESRIRTISYGEEKPFCFLSNEICWYQNRRAHFLVSLPPQSHRDDVR